MTTLDPSVEAFMAFIHDSKYSLMKQHEVFLKQAKEHLRSDLHSLPDKRHEFDKINMVAKFVTKEVRKINNEELISDLLNYVKPEFALSLITLDSKAMKEADMIGKASEYKLPDTYYLRPYLNKVGKRYNKSCDYMFGGQTNQELVSEIREVTLQHKEIEKEYERIKRRLHRYSMIENTRKIATPYGSLSMIANAATYDMQKLHENLGDDFLISFGKVKASELDELVMSGAIPKSIITNNRVVHDLRLDFVVMDLDDEGRMMNAYRNQRSRMSLKYA